VATHHNHDRHPAPALACRRVSALSRAAVSQVIKGWDEGIVQMSLGERATLTCTPDFGYGDDGAPPDIPPGAALLFDVELLGIEAF
jgi:FKBP-type peptidyl-prolyl cis-trans isomerase